MKKLVAFALTGLLSSLAPAADKVTKFHEDRLEIALPDGWKTSQQPMQGALGGWESSDRKTSVYVTSQAAGGNAEMRASLQGVVDLMDQSDQWALNKIGEFRDINLNGLPAVYVKVELDLTTGKRTAPFLFHLVLVGGRNSLFLLQCSTMKPIWQVREDEIFRVVKSFKVLKE